MYSQVKHIFFDFDNTLWDFEANSQKVLNDLIVEFELEKKCQCKADSFIKTYILVNDDLWALYRKQAITKDELRSSRFTNTMLYFGYDDLTLGLKLEDEYIARAPHQKELVPHTIEVLEYLSKKYDLKYSLVMPMRKENLSLLGGNFKKSRFDSKPIYQPRFQNLNKVDLASIVEKNKIYNLQKSIQIRTY